MPDINTAINFSSDFQSVISEKLGDSSFTYRDWGAEDLLALRKIVREFYRNEQKGICAYCRKDVSIQSASNCHVEHIAPKSKYRDFIFEPKNLCVICADCNEIKREQETLGEVIDTLKDGSKRKQYPRSTTAFKIVHPHFDVYDDNILILSGTYYLDKTEKGNFTIYACKLNRKLYAFGWERQIVDEAELFELMNKCLEEKSFTKRIHLIGQLKKLLLQL